MGTYGLCVLASRVGCVPEAQGGLPPGPHAQYVLGTRTSLGRSVRAAYRGTPGGSAAALFKGGLQPREPHSKWRMPPLPPLPPPLPPTRPPPPSPPPPSEPYEWGSGSGWPPLLPPPPLSLPLPPFLPPPSTPLPSPPFVPPSSPPPALLPSTPPSPPSTPRPPLPPPPPAAPHAAPAAADSACLLAVAVVAALDALLLLALLCVVLLPEGCCRRCCRRRRASTATQPLPWIWAEHDQATQVEVELALTGPRDSDTVMSPGQITGQITGQISGLPPGVTPLDPPPTYAGAGLPPQQHRFLPEADRPLAPLAPLAPLGFVDGRFDGAGGATLGLPLPPHHRSLPAADVPLAPLTGADHGAGHNVVIGAGGTATGPAPLPVADLPRGVTVVA